jgi:hypothetical protein
MTMLCRLASSLPAATTNVTSVAGASADRCFIRTSYTGAGHEVLEPDRKAAQEVSPSMLPREPKSWCPRSSPWSSWVHVLLGRCLRRYLASELYSDIQAILAATQPRSQIAA